MYIWNHYSYWKYKLRIEEQQRIKILNNSDKRLKNKFFCEL